MKKLKIENNSLRNDLDNTNSLTALGNGIGQGFTNIIDAISGLGVGGITIGGLSTGYVEGLKQGRLKKTPRPRLEALEGFFAKDGFKILLSHHPEYYPRYLKDKNVGLIISGHAHGGQWRMFGRGVFAPGQGLFPKYTSGIHDGRLIISRGAVNNSKPIPRFFNPSEILEIQILPKK
jgi:hypothetical protein